MWKTTAEIDIYEDKSHTADVDFPMVKKGALLSPGSSATNDDEQWKSVSYIVDGVQLSDGWVDASKLQPSDDQHPLIEVDQRTFVRSCVQHEIESISSEIYGEFPIVADYLIALAVIETQIANKRSDINGTTYIGPFQLSQSDWAKFRALNLHAANDVGWLIENPYQQIIAASDLAHDRQKKIAALHQADVGDQPDGPYVSDFLNVFHCHLIGPDATHSVIKAIRAEEGHLTIEEILNRHYQADETNQKIARRNRFTKINGEIATIEQFVGSTESVLDKALSRAHTLIREHFPEAIPQSFGEAAPWFSVAEEIKNRGVKEGTHNAEIISYFRATDSGITTLEHWCGAFVAHCLSEASRTTGIDELKDSIVKRSARAASWLTWGDTPLNLKQKKIPKGAVVVLSPGKGAGTSGHVGFFQSREGDFVYLLGGNQKDSVRISGFRASRVKAIRWQSFKALNPPVESDGVDFKAGPIPANRIGIAKLIVSKFAQAGFGPLQQIAALANAIRESKLNPNAHNASGEDSVGLFQCNRQGGLGTGKSVAFLKVPENNIQIIIDEAQKYNSFKNAGSIEKAVEVFVYKVERPRDKPGETNIRIGIAKKLIA